MTAHLPHAEDCLVGAAYIRAHQRGPGVSGPLSYHRKGAARSRVTGVHVHRRSGTVESPGSAVERLPHRPRHLWLLPCL